MGKNRIKGRSKKLRKETQKKGGKPCVDFFKTIGYLFVKGRSKKLRKETQKKEVNHVSIFFKTIGYLFVGDFYNACDE